MSLGARLGLGHASPAERGVDVERVSRNAVAHLARGAVEQIRRGDLEIVVRGMGEGAAPVAVAERPNVRRRWSSAIVDDDIAARVDLDACDLEAEVVGVRAAPDREQHMGA